jgi:hypothetical protein
MNKKELKMVKYLSLLIQKLCFPESPSLLIHLLLWPYRFIFINVGINNLLNGFLNYKKSLLDFSDLIIGLVYFWVIWGGFFGIFGIIFISIFTKTFIPESIIPFCILGIIIGVYVLKIRYSYFKTQINKVNQK